MSISLPQTLDFSKIATHKYYLLDGAKQPWWVKWWGSEYYNHSNIFIITSIKNSKKATRWEAKMDHFIPQCQITSMHTQKDKYGKESQMNKVPWECGDVQMETLAAVRGKAGDRREEKRSGC